MNAIGYIRVSTTGQEESGLGLDAQTAAIQDHADRRGIRLLRIYQDVESGGKHDRQGIQDALLHLQEGGAEALIVAKLDRLTRSLAHFAQIMDTSRRQGWALVAIDLGVDTSTAAGGMLAGVLASFAEYERRLIGERTRAALHAKRAADPDSLRRPHRSIPQALRDRIRELREAGWTLQQIAGLLQEAGVPTAQGGRWRTGTVSWVLTH